MTTAGWIFMALSITAVVTLVTWCYYRVLTAPTDPTEPPETLGG